MEQNLRIISLGGFGRVTQNMFVYETDRDILIVDCGLSFPPKEGKEGDLVIPDTSYLEARQQKIRGIVLTHGHEDHIGGLPFFRQKVKNAPIFASRLTAALAKEKLTEFNQDSRVNVVSSGQKISLGSFSLDFVHVTHSIPDTFCLSIQTPVGTVFHASDFKFDWTPVTGNQTDVGKIASIGNQGVFCLLSDCLRSERTGYTLSESVVEESIDREMKDWMGKVFITTMSSNVSRWQQAVNVTLKHHRKIVLIGRSIEKIFNIAIRLGYLNVPKGTIIKASVARSLPQRQIAVFVAGSQAQPSSALSKIGSKAFHGVDVREGDKVIFSSDYIPGNELAIHQLIDTLSRLGATVSYSDILDDLHVSGHAAQAEQALMIGLVRPKYLVPIGGAFRQMKQYALLSERMGYKKEQILLPDGGDVVELLANKTARISGRVEIGTRVVSSLS